jgi:hypothetical protein
MADTLRLASLSGLRFVFAFEQKILGISASELSFLKEQNDMVEYAERFRLANNRDFVFGIKAQSRGGDASAQFNDIPPRFQLVACARIDYAKDAAKIEAFVEEAHAQQQQQQQQMQHGRMQQ